MVVRKCDFSQDLQQANFVCQNLMLLPQSRLSFAGPMYSYRNPHVLLPYSFTQRAALGKKRGIFKHLVHSHWRSLPSCSLCSVNCPCWLTMLEKTFDGAATPSGWHLNAEESAPSLPGSLVYYTVIWAGFACLHLATPTTQVSVQCSSLTIYKSNGPHWGGGSMKQSLAASSLLGLDLFFHTMAMLSAFIFSGLWSHLLLPKPYLGPRASITTSTTQNQWVGELNVFCATQYGLAGGEQFVQIMSKTTLNA